MLVSNRGRERVAPNRDAKKYYIFCEGRDREYNYFRYFVEMNSKINIIPIQPEAEGDNSPTGLYREACKSLIQSENNPNPEKELLDIDEVWFVIDTDQWNTKIDTLRNDCTAHYQWYIAQSNPCFEVWLYYHFFNDRPEFEGQTISKKWKSFVNNSISGGFDHRKHPIHLDKANKNAKSTFGEKSGSPNVGCTEIFKLGESIYRLVQDTFL